MPKVSIPCTRLQGGKKRWMPASRASSRRRSRTLSCCSSTMKARTAARKCAMPGLKKDPRIRVLHPAKTGPGPSGARNAGVQAAAAPWLTMVDSDDTIAPDLVEKLLAGTNIALITDAGTPGISDPGRSLPPCVMKPELK